MSGGSYNYLAFDSNIAGREYDLRRMRDRVGDLYPESKAAAHLSDMILMLEEVDELGQKLSDVMYAVEWMDSSDLTKEDVDKEIKNYEDK